MSANEYPSVSVILPFQNNASTLERTLKSIMNQDYPEGQFELIMVCDTSTDGSVEIARTFQQSHPSNVTLIVNSNQSKGPAPAANQAMRNARGEILARMDGDAIVPPNWLSNLVRNFAREEVGGVEPFVIQTDVKAIVPFRSSAASGFGPGVGSSFRKSALSKVGYYDECYYHPFFGYFREDADLVFKLEEHGFQIVRDERVKVFHPDRKRSMRLIVTQGRKYGLDPLLLRQHPARSRALLHVKIGFLSSWGLAFIALIIVTLASLMGLLSTDIRIQTLTVAFIAGSYLGVVGFYKKLSGKWIPQSPILLFLFLATFGIARISGSIIFRKPLL